MVSEAETPSEKRVRRPTKACDQCRRRKQSCRGSTAPCERCSRLGKDCSLLVDEGGADPVAALREHVEELEQTVQAAQDRIARLEALAPATSSPEVTSRSGPSSYRPPIATLQALYSPTHVNSAFLTTELEEPRLDPISRSVLTMSEADHLFEIFFSACHDIAPCSSLRTQRKAVDVRRSSMMLFTSICLIGARYWDLDNMRENPNWLHPRYSELVALFDAQIHELILRPSSTDFTLEVVQSLLLSIQWPALEWSTNEHGSPGMKSRFNDAYAWVMVGLAMRFAKHVNLDKCHEETLSDENAMSRMRIWLNLISIDRHLTMTAGLPASLTAPPRHSLRAFSSHALAQPGDVRLAALAELVSISQLAAFDQRSLDSITLKLINHELDEWDRRWSVILAPHENFRQQMPHTALRWYRLALNAIPIGVILGDAPTNPPDQQILSLAVEAAFTLLWQYTSEACLDRPERVIHNDHRYGMNFVALSTFMFAIDAYWITHAYAAVFLILLYERGCIDCELRPQVTLIDPGPTPESSRLHRIITFALAMFDGVCQGASHHPATRYRVIVANALAKLDKYKAPAVTEGIDEMINALMEPGQEWLFLRDLGITL